MHAYICDIHLLLSDEVLNIYFLSLESGFHEITSLF